MRTYEMRVYSLRTKEALDFYASTVYPRHSIILGCSVSRPTAYGPRRTT